MKLIIQIFFLILLSPTLTASDVAYQIEFENHIAKRIEKSIKIADPYASAEVSLNFKKAPATLPGTGLVIDGRIPSGRQEIGFQGIDDADISEVNVVVHTSLANPPEWMKMQISEHLKVFKNARQKVRVEQVPQEVIDLYTKRLAGMSVNGRLTEIFNRFSYDFKVALGSLLLSFAGILLTYFFMTNSRQKRFQSALLEQISNFTDKPFQRSSSFEKDLRTQDRPTTRVATSQQIQDNGLKELSIPQLLALMSDCYWCEEDGYAAYVWNNLSPKARNELIDAWAELTNYTKFLSSVSNQVNLNLHAHPYYLRPIEGLEAFSNQELKEFLKKEPGIWNSLSPLRQMAMSLSLAEQIKCLESKSKRLQDMIPTQSLHKINKRNFKDSSSIRLEISPEEEKQIFENSRLVPEEYIPMVYSLVWLAMLPLNDRQEVLRSYSAEELASAFVGEQVILNSLKEAISEKKMKLIDSYKTKVTPTKDSEIYQSLFTEGMRRYQEHRGREKDVHAA